MGDCHFSCAASGIPIGPRESAVGILVSRSKEKEWTHASSPTSHWEFVAGPFRIGEVGDYTPLSDFRDLLEEKDPRITKALAAVAPLIHHPDNLSPDRQWTGYPHANSKLEYRWSKECIDHYDLATVWFRTDVWKYLRRTGAKEIRYWGEEVRTEVRWLAGFSDKISEGMARTIETRRKLGQEENPFDLHGVAADSVSRQNMAAHGLMSFIYQYDRKLDETWARGFLEFLNVWHAMEQCHLSLRPNNYCSQEQWYGEDAADALRKYTARIIQKTRERQGR